MLPSLPVFLPPPGLSKLSLRGGDEEVRTPDPLRARQVLSQLSYTPMLPGFQVSFPLSPTCEGTSGFHRLRAFKIKQHLLIVFLITDL